MAFSTVPLTGALPRSAPIQTGSHRRRALLVGATVLTLALVTGLGGSAAAETADPDLVRLLQFMAGLKGGFAALALAACYWRLGRPSAPWREAVYIVGPAAMAAGAVCLWQLQSAGLAALVLHAGMFVLLAAALTDEAFIPALRRRAR